MGGGGRSARHTSARQSSNNMNANVNIDLYTALLGGEVIIQLTDGKKLKLKRLSRKHKTERKFVLRGKGYDRGDGTFGDDYFLQCGVATGPFTEYQKDLLRQMRQCKPWRFNVSLDVYIKK